jgi:hypothetical protein
MDAELIDAVKQIGVKAGVLEPEITKPPKGSDKLAGQAQLAASVGALECYYDGTKFLIPTARGEWSHVDSRMLRIHLRRKGFTTNKLDGENLTELEFAEHEIVQHPVAFSGALAGQDKGMIEDMNGARVLVTSSPKRITPQAGDFPILKKLLAGMFPEEDGNQSLFLFGWLKTARLAFKSGCFKPGQALVLAGEPESGKTLLRSLITEILGGRSAKPYQYMTGGTGFNADLFGAEVLGIDDEQASTDIRSRRALGARIKEMLFSPDQRCHGKGRQAVILRPFWRLVLCTNCEPENLMVLPPLDESLRDKITILKVSKREMPMPTGTTEQTALFWETLIGELPVFLYWLEDEFQVPEDLKSPRCGIREFHDPELLESINDLSPEFQLLEAIDRVLFEHRPEADPWRGKAETLQRRLEGDTEMGGSVKRLLSFRTACGTYLGRLALARPDRIQSIRTKLSREWEIRPISQQS